MSQRERLIRTTRESLVRGMATVRWLTLIMVPASAAVFVLRATGVLAYLSQVLEPVMQLIGLPGAAAVALISGIFINLYAVIAVATELALSESELIVLALFALIAHNLPVEVLVTRRTGTPVARMLALRLGGATAVAAVVARARGLTAQGGAVVQAGQAVQAGETMSGGAARMSWQELPTALGQWGLSTAETTLRVAVVVVVLLVATRLLNEFGVMEWIARRLRWLTGLLGLPAASGGPWLVANTLGLAYGAAVLTEEAESGRLSAADGDLLNHHLGISHSILEDTLLFVAIGAPAVWILLPRLIAATVAVWERRVERRLGWSRPTQVAEP